MAVDYTTHDGVAVITLNNPPVNGLGLSTRAGIVEGIERAQNDPAIKAIVLTGAGKAFSGGADITEFNTPKATQEPTLATVIKVVEGSAKPVVAAIHSVAMGGGLELALGAHYRIAAPGAQIALPEVKLGILPGAGGTQRLPRAIGLEAALNMIVSGAPVMSEKLADSGLFDEVAQGDLADAALAFARKVGAKEGPHPKVRDRKIEHPNAAGFIQFARNTVARDGQEFPGAAEMYRRGRSGRAERFRQGPRVRARMLHGARADARKPCAASCVLRRTRGEQDSRCAVGHAGARHQPGGRDRRGHDGRRHRDEFRQRGHSGHAAGNEAGSARPRPRHDPQELRSTVKKGKLKPEALEQRMALITPTLSYDDLRDADLVIEAVFEELGVKEQVFKQLDEVVKPGAILASNTSTLDVDKIAAFTKRPQDVVGMHFFSPANVMKLLEVVRGEETAKDVLATVMKLAKKIRKTAVVSGVCDGFIGNRMIEQYIRQALFMLEEGALPAQVDKAIEKFGFAMGPFRMGDLAGNDIGWAIRKRRYQEQPDMHYSKIADRLCETGRFGQKTGAGWYDYKAGDRTAYPSKVVDEMIVAYLEGSQRRAPQDQRRGNRRAPGVRAGQRRRADSRRRHCVEGVGHRHGLPDRLRLPAVPRRPDAVCRHGRPLQRRARDSPLRGAAEWRCVAMAPSIAELAAKGRGFNG